MATQSLTLSTYYPTFSHRELSDIVAEHGAPLYLYDRKTLEQRSRVLQSILGERSAVFFASFCNSNPSLLELLKETGMGILVSSPAEFQVALAVGFSPSQMTATGAAHSARDLALFVDHGVEVNLDSLSQVERLGNVHQGVNIGIRVNLSRCLVPDSDGVPLNSCLGAQSRVGVFEEELEECIQLAQSHGNSVRTLHAYCGTNQQTPELLELMVSRLFELADRFTGIEVINIGGGFGISYLNHNKEFPFFHFADFLIQKQAQFRAESGREIVFHVEPGRSVIAPTGVMIAEVVDVKVRPDREVIVTTNGSLSCFPRPYIYREEGQHSFSICSRQLKPIQELPIRICGNALASGDVLGTVGSNASALPDPGDFIVFYDAGAYGYSMSSQFSGRVRPAEVLLDGDELRCIRQAEPLDALLQNTAFMPVVSGNKLVPLTLPKYAWK